jgi:CRISPR/Cas system endoribonuclease Cas6 (RAMP superfamily)
MRDIPNLPMRDHSYEKVRPYNIHCYIHKGEPLVEFTLVSYNQSLSSLLQDIFSSLKNRLINVAQKKYQIQDIRIEDLHLEQLIMESKPVRHFHVSFITPVHFQTSKGNYPIRFPMPIVFFSNMVKIWNSIPEKSAKIDVQDFFQWIEPHCFVSGFKMRSTRYYINTNQIVAGGVGYVTYRIKKPNSHFYEQNITCNTEFKNTEEDITFHYQNNCHWIDLLCRTAEYTNVGSNRTAGMGHIKYYPKSFIEKKQLAKLNPPLR